ncbi:hypothetical protein RHMOL_Rhmol11G0010500 [Rhododendron molle]|uniref:Uncharacterized protein n=1 Tax=Rhododendron molle TaxID=49168 RepID=A0ACC0LMT2_RHOML|nr:hypothetical protein RHMOL_Rhmol11G0010500 [Rhododendron molle]
MSTTFPLPLICCWAGHGSIVQTSWLCHLLFTKKSFGVSYRHTYNLQGLRHSPLKEDETLVLGIMHDEKDVDLGGFSFDPSGSILAINMDRDFIRSSVAVDIMKRMSYLPGLGLGIHHQRTPKFPTFPSCEGHFGLGYVTSAKDAKRRKCPEKP